MVTIGKGKHFSLGLDLEGLISLSAPEVMEFSDELQKLLGRILTFPLVTVAAINGKLMHAYFLAPRLRPKVALPLRTGTRFA